MKIKQLSVFVENKFGMASDIIEILSENNINISALSIADTSKYGVMRLIVDDTEKAQNILSENGIMVKTTNVIAVPMLNKPGELAVLLKIFKGAEVSVEYMYAFVTPEHNGAVLVLKTDNNQKALDALRQNGISPLNSEE